MTTISYSLMAAAFLFLNGCQHRAMQHGMKHTFRKDIEGNVIAAPVKKHCESYGGLYYRNDANQLYLEGLKNGKYPESRELLKKACNCPVSTSGLRELMLNLDTGETYCR